MRSTCPGSKYEVDYCNVSECPEKGENYLTKKKKAKKLKEKENDFLKKFNFPSFLFEKLELEMIFPLSLYCNN